MLFVRRLIEFIHLPDGEQQTPDTKVELPSFFLFFLRQPFLSGPYPLVLQHSKAYSL